MVEQLHLEGTEVPSKVRPIPHGLCVLGRSEVAECRAMLTEVQSRSNES